MVRLAFIGTFSVSRFSTVARSLRNVGIIAHIDAGKTTTTERILYNAGKINYVGEVDKGNTVTDYLDQERERGISIISATASFQWKEHNINIIDTPGHVDFTLEVERALTVLDGSITILDSRKGVQAQTQTVWNQSKNHKIASIFYINKFDRKNSNLNLCLKSIRNKLSDITPLLIHLPYYSKDTGEFCGILDIVDLKLYQWHPKTGHAIDYSAECHSRKISDSELLFMDCLETRLQLLETLSDLDDGALRHEFLLLDNPAALIPSRMIHDCLRKVTISAVGSPVLIGSSRMNIGVINLMDKIVDYLPNPSEKQVPVQFHNLASHPDYLSALAFKVVHDPFRGPLTFLRLYSGSLKPKSNLKNLTRATVEKVEKVMQMTGEQYAELDGCSGGNIVAVSGFKNCYTGDVLVDVSMPHVVDNESFTDLIPIPDPVIFASIEAYSSTEIKDLESALCELTKEDPSLNYYRDEDTKQLVIGGMGSLHLEVILERIRSDYKLQRTKMGKLKIVYKECPTEYCEMPVSYAHQLSCNIQGTNAILSLELKGDQHSFYNEESQVEFVNSKTFVWGNIPPPVFGLIKKTFLKVLHNGGPQLRSQLMGLRLYVHNFTVEPSYISFTNKANHPILCSFIFEAARGLFSQLKTDVLEPMMQVEISFYQSDSSDQNYMSKVINDLNRRRSKIISVERIIEGHPFDAIKAYVPLSETLDYSSVIRSLSSGQSSIHMHFSHYDRMQKEAEESLTKRKLYHSPNVLDNK